VSERIAVRLKDCPGFESFLSQPLDGGVALWWLGQSGFALRHGNLLILIDLYLSDHLAKKYSGAEFSHERMMAAPVRPEKVRGLDFVFCTHRHSDHMDPGTLPVLQENNPDCKFLVPRAELGHALGMGLKEERTIGLNDGERLELGAEASVEAVAAAHEDLMTNPNGEHHFLGYLFRFGGIRIYHSGDCVPYNGLEDRLRDKGIQLALLPVNGRDETRQSRGIVGNFTLEEALGLCDRLDIPHTIGHHFGMFDFNTLSPVEATRKLESLKPKVRCHLPEVGWFYMLS